MTDTEQRQEKIEAAFKVKYQDATALARVILPEIMEAPQGDDRNLLGAFVVCTFQFPNGEPVGELEMSASEGLTDEEVAAAETEVGEIVQTFLGSVRDENGTGAEFGARLVGLLASCPNDNARLYALGMVLQSDVVPFVQIPEHNFEGALDSTLATKVGNRFAVMQSALEIVRVFQIGGKTHGQRIAAVRHVLARHKTVEFDYLLDLASKMMRDSIRSARPPVEMVMLDGSGGDLLQLLGMGTPPPVETPREGEGIGDVLLRLQRSLKRLVGLDKRDGGNASGHDDQPSPSGMSAAQMKSLLIGPRGMPEELFDRWVARHEGPDSTCRNPDCVAGQYIALRNAEAAASRDGTQFAKADDEPDGDGRSRADRSRDRV